MLSAVKFISLASLACLLAGCNDYLDHSDRMTPFSGEAQAANRAAHVIDPWPAHAADRNFSTKGERMQRAMDNYKHGATPSASSTTGSASGSESGGESGESGSGASTTGSGKD